MVEISTSILTVNKGEESATFCELEAAKTDYFHIDVMDGELVEKNTYEKMMNVSDYITAIDLAPSIKPFRHTYLHEEKYRELAKRTLNEDPILKRIFHIQ